MSDLYQGSFYNKISSGSVRSARVILPLVLERFPTASAVDVGCGSGAWLSVLRELGCSDVLGIDGDWAAGDTLMIPTANFLECDLSSDWPTVDRRFDLALTTEVAEHLPTERNAELVALLCRLADVVVFSAAIPRQGGVSHVNEQWQSYWAELFRAQGYGAVDVVRPQVWTNDDVEFWYRQNLLVYAKGVNDDVSMLDVVHPRMAGRGNSREKSRIELFARSRARRIRSAVRKLRG